MAVLAKVMVIEHGWVEKDGVIIDPTLPHDDMQYFPVCGSADSGDWLRKWRSASPRGRRIISRFSTVSAGAGSKALISEKL